jgi:hypothetical protein
MNVPEHEQAEKLGNLFEQEQEAVAAEEQDAKASAAPEEPVAEPESGEAEEVEAESEEPEEAAAEEEPAEAEEAEEPTEEEVEISSLDDLAQALEVEPDELAKHLQVKIGEESMPLSSVIERASQMPLPEQMAQMMGEQREVVTTQETERAQKFNDTQALFFGAVQAMITQAEMEGGFSDAELARLKAEDPERWAIKAEERRQFSAQIDAGVNAARQNQAANQEREAEVYRQRATEEGMKLIQAIPAWQVQDVAIKEATEISEFIQKEYNFSAEEMADMPDHRLALAFRDLFIAKNAVAKTEKTKKTLTKKKLKARTSVIPTRPRRAKGDPRATALAAARKRQRQTVGDQNRVTEHEDATAELLEGQL